LKKCAEFTKIIRRICKLRAQNLYFLAQHSDNPFVCLPRHYNGDGYR